jgi:hypothetical protein
LPGHADHIVGRGPKDLVMEDAAAVGTVVTAAESIASER